MSWVQERLEKSKSKPKEQQAVVQRVPERPAWETTWKAICDTMERDVIEFNNARGPQFMVRSDSHTLQVIPRQPLTDTVVVQVEDVGMVQLDCPISHPGVPRRGKFRIQANGTIVVVGGIVGQPPPTPAEMTPEEFSRFALEPLLFPEK